MKIMFITKPYVIDPLGIAYLSRYIKSAGSLPILCLTTDNLIEKIKEHEPKLLAYSTTTGDHVYYRNLNKYLRQNSDENIRSIFGGAHPTFFPEFINEEYVDYCCIGEGYTAILDVLDKKLNVENIITKDNSEIRLRPLLDKSKLLSPDREIIYQFPQNYNNPIKNIMCSMGCIFSCSYCYNHKLKEYYNIRKPEIRPVEMVMREVDELKSYPLKLIFFQDDLFPIYDKEWINEFCNRYYEFQIPFHIQIRVEFVTEDVVKQLKAVGLHSATFAIESGNPDIRRNMLNRKMTDKQILDAANIFHQYGINFRTENMIGIPTENYEDVLSTLDLNIQCNPTIAWASLFQPYPGTKLGDYCKENDLIEGNFDSFDTSFFNTYRLKSRYVKAFQRIQRLFALLVKYPKLKYLLPILIRLPLDNIYYRFYKYYKKHLYNKKLFSLSNN